MSVTITIILDTRRIKTKTNEYPIKLRVTFDRVTAYYQTIYDLSKERFNKLSASRVSKDLQTIRSKLNEIERTAKNATQELDPFSLEGFEKHYIKDHSSFRKRKSRDAINLLTVDDFDYSPFIKRFRIFEHDHSKPGGVSNSFFTYIKNKLSEGRIGTAVSMHCAYNSIIKFRGNVSFRDISVSYLNQYEQWLLSNNVSKTTISIYTRALRTIFNEAIDTGLIKREKCYPFGRRKYRILASRNIKKALTIDDISKIYYYKCNSGIEGEQKAKDFWLFSYFANGINPKDIAVLQWKNIEDEYLVFERAKTERSMRSDPKLITVFINQDMWDIINRWGNIDRSPNNYIFPILEQGMTPLRQYDVVQLFHGLIREWMQKIGKDIGIEKNITTYVARHTFSTVLKRSGASTEYIQEALGHSSMKTTQNYLDSFEREIKKEFASKLIAFKHNVNKQSTDIF